jgi:copper oxidase (laccase) domain-containing protein
MTEGNGHGVMTNLGESALTGWQGALGKAIAKPVAKRTKWTEDQIRAVIGLAILAFAFYRLAKPTVAAIRRST